MEDDKWRRKKGKRGGKELDNAHKKDQSQRPTVKLIRIIEYDVNMKGKRLKEQKKEEEEKREGERRRGGTRDQDEGRGLLGTPFVIAPHLGAVRIHSDLYKHISYLTLPIEADISITIEHPSNPNYDVIHKVYCTGYNKTPTMNTPRSIQPTYHVRPFISTLVRLS